MLCHRTETSTFVLIIIPFYILLYYFRPFDLPYIRPKGVLYT